MDGEGSECAGDTERAEPRDEEGEKTAKMPRKVAGWRGAEPCWQMYASGSCWNPLLYGTPTGSCV